MGRKAQMALMPVGCALILLAALNHVTLHLNVWHFAVILGVVAVACIAIGGWASVQELRGAPSGVRGSAPTLVSYGAAPAESPAQTASEALVPAPVAAGPDDQTIQSS